MNFSSFILHPFYNLHPFYKNVNTSTGEVDLAQANGSLKTLSAEDRILWVTERFGDSAILLSSMQKTASVLMHMFHRLELENEIVFVDTGYHFHETLRFRDEFLLRYKLNLVTVYPEFTPEQQEQKFGKKLYLCVDGQPECCRLRKEVPFQNYMRGKGRQVAMIGARRADRGRRVNLQPLAKDPRIGGFTLHPLFDWSDDRVKDYLRSHQVPVHPLHEKGYPSIGCGCCTTPIEPGEDPRAGRWRHLRTDDGQNPLYCGLNFTDGSGI